MVALDLSKAFERVEHTLLLKEVAETNLHSNLVRWLRSYLRGRVSYVEYQNTRSTFRRNHFGVPQGGVISPILFNFFVRDFPDCAEITVNYADDFSILESGVDLAEVEAKLNEDLATIADWARRKRLYLAPEKSSVTLFSADTHQFHYHPQVFLNGALIPLDRNPKILGITLDPQLTFGPHARTVVAKVGARLKIMKALSGTDWGHSHEDLEITFKSLVTSVINYGAPIYSPNLKPTHINKIQCAQNHCLRVVTGAHAAASLEHLHRETKILPVGDHLALLARQFLAQASVSSHPSNSVVSGDPGRRSHRHTLSTLHGSSVNPFLRGGAIPRDSLRDTLTDLHTAAVACLIRKLDETPNRVLGYVPPPVDPSSYVTKVMALFSLSTALGFL